MSSVELTRPVEWLDITDGGTFDIAPIDSELGFSRIMPRPPAPQIEKTIDVLRLYYDKDPETPGLDYVDVSSQTLIAQINPILDDVIKGKLTIRIKAFGVAPKKRFTVQILQ